MATLKKHWRILSLQTALAALCLTLIVGTVTVWDDRPAAAQAGKTQDLDPLVYSRTQALRRHLALTNPDLAAMGLSREQAKAVLGDLLAWVKTNQAGITARDRSVLTARRALRQAQRRIRVGPRDEADLKGLPKLRKSLADAESARRTLLDGAGATPGQRLTADQKAVWQAAKANAGAPARYRHVSGLNAAKTRALREALARRGTDATRSRYAAADHQLTATQKSALAAAVANQRRHLDHAHQAEAAVLPVPPELAPELLDDEPAATTEVE